MKICGSTYWVGFVGKQYECNFMIGDFNMSIIDQSGDLQ